MGLAFLSLSCTHVGYALFGCLSLFSKPRPFPARRFRHLVEARSLLTQGLVALAWLFSVWLDGMLSMAGRSGNKLACSPPPPTSGYAHTRGQTGRPCHGSFATFNSAFLFLALQSVLCIFSFDWKQGSSKKCSEWPRIPHFCPSDALELFMSDALYIACREVVTLVPCMCRLKRVHVSAQQFNFGLL